MLGQYVEAGGPLMYACLATWVVVLAGMLDRLLYVLGRAVRRPRRAIEDALRRGAGRRAASHLHSERRLSEHGLARIDAVSQIATSVGLFGTVCGIARSFFARGTGALGASDELTAGLSTALFTTIAGLVVFLMGQGFLIAYGEWRAFCERGLEDAIAACNGDEVPRW